MRLTSSTHQTRNPPQFTRVHNRGTHKPGRAYPQVRNRAGVNRWPARLLARRAYNMPPTHRTSMRRRQGLSVIFSLYVLLGLWLCLTSDGMRTPQWLAGAGGVLLFGIALVCVLRNKM